jgi:hypothetical protein
MAFSNRKIFTVNHTLIGGSNLTDFRMLVYGTYSDLRHTSSGGTVTSLLGYDIIFTSDALGTLPLSFELVFYDPTTGTVEFWVKTNLSSSVDTPVYLFSGDSSITTYQGTTATWSGYGAVYPLPDGSAVNYNDSTANANNATGHGSPTAVSGQIDGAAHFTTQNVDYADTPDNSSLHLATPFTISAWVNLDSHNSGFVQLIVTRQMTGSSWNYNFYIDGSTTNPVFAYANGTIVFMHDSVGTVGLGVWTYVAVVVTASATPHAAFYINGVHTSTQNAFISLPSTGSAGIIIAGANAGNAVLKGSLDTLHLMPFDNTAYLLAEYNNQFSPSTFYTVSNANNYSETAVGVLNFGGSAKGTIGHVVNDCHGAFNFQGICFPNASYSNNPAHGAIEFGGSPTEARVDYASEHPKCPIEFVGLAPVTTGTVEVDCVFGDTTDPPSPPPPVTDGPYAY